MVKLIVFSMDFWHLKFFINENKATKNMKVPWQKLIGLYISLKGLYKSHLFF